MMVRCVLLAAVLAAFSMPGLAQSQLTVGTKVIYPGGTDQPPKEKDTGVSLKVGNLHGAVGNGSPSFEGEGTASAYEDMLQSGQAEDLLRALRGKIGPLARTYRALALLDLGREADARREIERALADRQFPEDLRSRLTDALPEPLPVEPAPPTGTPAAPVEPCPGETGSPPDAGPALTP